MKLIIFRPLIALLMGVIFLFSQFMNHTLFPTVLNFLALMTIISYIPYLRFVPKFLISTLMALSILIYLIQGEGLIPFYQTLSTNVGLTCIFIFVPLLSIPIKDGKYLEYVEIMFNHYIKTSKQLYSYLKLALLSIGSIMNLGAVPILHQLTDTKSLQDYEIARLKALGRGFALCFLWSPYFISVALIISYFDITWVQLFPLGILIALVGIILGVLFESRRSEPLHIYSSNRTVPIKLANRKVFELLFVIFIITVMTISIEYFIELSVLTIIPIVAIIVSLIWSVLLNKLKNYGRGFFDFTQERLPYLGNELLLFLAAGIFGQAILEAGASEWIIYLLEQSGITHILIIMFFIIIMINVLAFIGVDPFITVTALAVTFSSSSEFTDYHLILGLTLLLSWALTMITSPFSTLNLTLSSLTQLNPLRAGIKLNWKFTLAFAALGFSILTGFYYIV